MKKFSVWGQAILLTLYMIVFSILGWMLTIWTKSNVWFTRNYHLAFHSNRCIKLHFVIGTGKDFLDTGKITVGHVYHTVAGNKVKSLGNNVFLCINDERNIKSMSRKKFLKQYPVRYDEAFQKENINHPKHGI